MRILRILLLVCAATAAQSALADDQSTLAAIQAACAEDAQKLCAGVQPGGGRIVACLKEHKDSLSSRCKQAAAQAANPSSSSAPSAPSAPPASGTNAPAPAAGAPVPKSGSSGAGANPPAKSSRSDAGPSGPAAAPKAKSAPASKAASEPITVAGERFVQRAVVDTKQGGMTAVTIHIPESWHFDGTVEWNYGWIEVPVATSWHAENPANAEAYFQYPLLRMSMVDVAPRLRQYVKNPKPGERTFSGAIYMAPVPPMQAMAAFIKKVRGDVTNLKWLGSQDLPGLGKALRLDLAAWPTNHGLAIKIGYDLNGQPVEEAFFGVYYLNKVGAPAVQAGHESIGANEIQQTDWGFDGLQSFRAPAGTLDKRMSIFCLMAKSVQYDPKWLARQNAISATLTQMFNEKLKQGWDQIRAAQAIMDQTMKEQAAFQANFDKQEAAFRNSPGINDDFLRDHDGGGGNGGTRSASDHWSDLIRGVDTVNDSTTGGTIQLSNQGQYHFTDGFGNYRTTDDSNYTPEKAGEVGSWTLMTSAP